ncbi:MAG: hypothetical protein HY076_00470 [Candidatus Eisenbacteria bacterium]|uniref:DUF3108 domain-containing protein n=1 Tax=Eiseniibacteriota bacterium TaxID=2212470 RepID=A0A9D6QN85_UNCEI|nr:hypothetical protein [Candidatus Eisenbacteria bacterium]MBI3538734.1 hypothetical protein [Candidatus Eisenbacteria bacterium]
MIPRSAFRLALPALLAAALAAPARAEIVDQGTFKLAIGQHPLGVEAFVYESAQDSLVVRARQRLVVPPRGDTLEKDADVLVGGTNFALRGYQSNRIFHGRKIVRALVLADTHYVAYREGEGTVSTGDSYVLPPGRLYVMDSQVMTLFDLICRSLHDERFERRPINLLALGPVDTMLEAAVVSKGSETIRWGGKPVVARKLDIVADSRTTFTAWTGRDGRLLRLTEPVSGLLVTREPPPVKRRTTPAPRPMSVSRRPKPGG